MKKLAPIALVLVSAFSITACTTTERTLTGAALGGATGALVGGAVAGTPGAVLGAAAGGAGGAIIARGTR
jgi:osmotically inducible lipoprotein OsmB